LFPAFHRLECGSLLHVMQTDSSRRSGRRRELPRDRKTHENALSSCCQLERGRPLTGVYRSVIQIAPAKHPCSHPAEARSPEEFVSAFKDPKVDAARPRPPLWQEGLAAGWTFAPGTRTLFRNLCASVYSQRRCTAL
jgi:uncharacterized protein (DUF2237 family)